MLLNHSYAVVCVCVCWGLLDFFLLVFFFLATLCMKQVRESGVSSSRRRPIENLRFICRKSFCFILLELLLLLLFQRSSPRLFPSIIYWLCCTTGSGFKYTMNAYFEYYEMRRDNQLCCRQNKNKRKCRWGVLSITHDLFSSRNIIPLLPLKSSFSHSAFVLTSNIALSKSGLPLATAQSQNVTISICVLMWFSTKQKIVFLRIIEMSK